MADPDAPDSRRALVEAAKSLLPRRPPSTVTGRELAEAAGVNYGLVHHYFGGKDAVLREALLELRDEFLAQQADPEMPELLRTTPPFLLAVGRSQIDYPDSLGRVEEFPLGDAMVTGVRRRLADSRAVPEPEVDAEARARAAAMLSLQLGRNLYGDLLRDTVGAEVEPAGFDDALAELYRDLAVLPAADPD